MKLIQAHKNLILEKRKEIATDLASKIERMLKSFRIKGIVQEVTFERRSVLLALQLAEGVKVESIEELRRTIAATVASRTGDVEIIAPLPGTTRVGIRVPNSGGNGSYRIARAFYLAFGLGLMLMLIVGFSNTLYQLVNNTGNASPSAVGLYFVLVPTILTITLVKAGTIWFDAKFRLRGHKSS